MASGPLILAVDQGTSSTKALLVDGRGAVVARGAAPLTESHPRPGWVEQSPDELWESVRRAVAACVDPALAGRVAGVAFSTQRESLVLWERHTGRPVRPLVSWQDQRTAADCAELAAEGAGDLVRAVSGMPLDPMFSALKGRWLLDACDPDRRRSLAGELCLGTVDSWLLSRFGGEHVVEVGNASRTQLMDVSTGGWDERLLALFGIPRSVLPRIVPSCGPFPAARGLPPLPDGVPVLAVLGDSHAAMFAHCGWRPGVVKVTYGTGSSVMSIATPSRFPDPEPDRDARQDADGAAGPGRGAGQDAGGTAGLCRSVAWDVGDGPVPAAEGNIRATGRTLTWLAELFRTTSDALLAELDASPDGAPEGVRFVPAFGGLGAPWWEPEAEALVTGLTLGTGRPQLVAAALEAVAFQVEDVVEAVERVSGPVEVLLADGGLTRSDRMMRLQADLSGRTVARSGEHDLSCLGAACAAGLAAGLWTRAGLEERRPPADTFRPATASADRDARRAAWRAAVSRSLPSPAAPHRAGSLQQR
ncbi:FGGY family carbohydrate kinase [Nonomuraea zeae]|uniref:Glycerol kinase n=1 Tax=Nonomuraea zeae TaxID=1642303 RepID=A0A5S4H106_9ACTN|nr:FGGY family carbohydrate kinase [Nonomuraea zeae]TMR38602.1 glycerol kinase [Nonomuraea zeae]